MKKHSILTIQTASGAKRYKIDPWIRIYRNVESGTVPFTEVFGGFEKLDSVKGIFGPDTEKILSELKVELFPREGFMGVSDEDGHIFASSFYVSKGELWSVYLDTVHELVHVRQFMEGKNLFDPSFSYVDRPTEVEAYRVGVSEARRIGLSEQEIFDYLEVPWVTKTEHVRLANTCNLNLSQVVVTKKNQGKGTTTKKSS